MHALAYRVAQKGDIPIHTQRRESNGTWTSVEYIHPSTDPTHQPKQQLDWVTHFSTITQQSPLWLQWGTPHWPINLPHPLRRSRPHLIHPSLDWPHSLSQTASGSNQPFFHSPLTRQTDSPTDRRQVYSNNAYALLIERNVLIIPVFRGQRSQPKLELPSRAPKAGGWLKSETFSQ